MIFKIGAFRKISFGAIYSSAPLQKSSAGGLGPRPPCQNATAREEGSNDDNEQLGTDQTDQEYDEVDFVLEDLNNNVKNTQLQENDVDTLTSQASS